MKKRFAICSLAMMFAFGSVMNVCAKEQATLAFTEKEELEYRDVETYEDGTVRLGNSFEGIAPGESAAQTITVVNENEITADFYMEAGAIQALEAAREAAKGAGYDIKLTAGENVLYDSKVGGYANSTAEGSEDGILAMNSGALDGYMLVATLKKGESTDISLEISFDGEAMDNQEIDYSNAIGQVGFAFRVAYEEPGKPNVVYKEITKKGEDKKVVNLVEIIEERVPLSVVATGDMAMIGTGLAVLIAGVILVVMTGKKKKVEE